MERHGVQFANSSTRNTFANNVILGVQIRDGKAVANPSARAPADRNGKPRADRVDLGPTEAP